MTHPNSFAAAVTTLLALLVVWIAQRLGYAHMTVEQSLALAGGAITAVLFLGRRIWTVGLKGIARALWNGTTAVVAGTTAKASKTPADN